MAKRKKKHLIICPYCRGQIKHCDSEKDHVPPQSIFPSPRPSNLVTVRCCPSCHDSLSKGDEALKVMVGYGMVRPNKTAELKPSLDRAFKRNPWWKNSFMKSVKNGSKIDLQIGQITADAIILPLDDDFAKPVMITIERICKGLLFSTIPELDTTELEFEIFNVKETQISVLPDLINGLGKLTHHLVIDRDLFFAMWGTIDDEPRAGILLMSIHVGLNFCIFFGPHGYMKNADEMASLRK